jgi:hypothetical protein
VSLPVYFTGTKNPCAAAYGALRGQKNFKGVGGSLFRPKTCTDDVIYTHFSRENVPLNSYAATIKKILVIPYTAKNRVIEMMNFYNLKTFCKDIQAPNR